MVDVHWIQPFRKDKNIGKGINEAIKQLQADKDDWIVLMDHDIMFLQPDTKSHIIDILETTDYDILGCATNRLGSNDQLIMGMFDEYSITTHVARAKEVWEYNGDGIAPAEVVAGMLMCFKVSTWRTLGGFDENRINFDWLFCTRAPRAGLKVGIMAGIYVMHLYRWGSTDPANDIKHLQV